MTRGRYLFLAKMSLFATVRSHALATLSLFTKIALHCLLRLSELKYQPAAE